MSLRNAMILSALAFGLTHAGAAQAPEFCTTAPHEPPRGNAKSGAARAKRDAKKRRNKKRQRGFADPMFLLGMMAVIAVAVIAWAAVVASRKERGKWERFKAEQQCVVVEQRDAETMSTTGFNSNGDIVFGTTVNPAKTAWKCNDGITYWKDAQ